MLGLVELSEDVVELEFAKNREDNLNVTLSKVLLDHLFFRSRLAIEVSSLTVGVNSWVTIGFFDSLERAQLSCGSVR